MFSNTKYVSHRIKMVLL